MLWGWGAWTAADGRFTRVEIDADGYAACGRVLESC